MANYTIDKFSYGGNTYTLEDNTKSFTGTLSGETFTTTLGNDSTTLTLAEGTNVTIVADSEGGNDVTYTISTTGGSTYTASSPIDITNDVISHDASGVTAGTYDGGTVKETGFYIPSFTINSTGHVTSATDLGTLLPDLTSSYPTGTECGVLRPSAWAVGLRTSTPYGSVLAAGYTSATITISTDYDTSYSYRTAFRVVDVQAYDVVTFEPVIVDWAPSAINSAGSSITITISLAAAWPNALRLFPVLTWGAPLM